MASQFAFDFNRGPAVTTEDARRLSRQCVALLERLKLGPALNSELVHIAMNLTARISELRQAGHRVDAKRMGGGLFEYRLVGER